MSSFMELDSDSYGIQESKPRKSSRQTTLRFGAVFLVGLIIGSLVAYGITVKVLASSAPGEEFRKGGAHDSAPIAERATYDDDELPTEEEATEHCQLLGSLGMLEATIRHATGLEKHGLLKSAPVVQLQLAGGQWRETSEQEFAQDIWWDETIYVCVPRQETSALNLRGGDVHDWEVTVQVANLHRNAQKWTMGLIHEQILGRAKFSSREIIESDSLTMSTTLELSVNGKKTGAMLELDLEYIPLGPQDDAELIPPKCEDPRASPDGPLEMCTMVDYSTAKVINNQAFTFQQMDESAKATWLQWADETPERNLRKGGPQAASECREFAKIFFCSSTFQKCDRSHDGVNGYGLSQCKETCKEFFTQCYDEATAQSVIALTCNNLPSKDSGECGYLPIPTIDPNPPSWEQMHTDKVEFTVGSLPGMEVASYFRPKGFKKPMIVGVRNIVPKKAELEIEVDFMQGGELTLTVHNGMFEGSLEWFFKMLGFPGFHDSHSLSLYSPDVYLSVTAKVVKNEEDGSKSPEEQDDYADFVDAKEYPEEEENAYEAEATAAIAAIDAGKLSIAYAVFKGQSYRLQHTSVDVDIELPSLPKAIRRLYGYWFKNALERLVAKHVAEAFDTMGAAMISTSIGTTMVNVPQDYLVNWFGMNENTIDITFSTTISVDNTAIDSSASRRLAGLRSAPDLQSLFSGLEWTVKN